MPGDLAISAITLVELNFSVLIAKTTGVRAGRLRRGVVDLRIAATAHAHGASYTLNVRDFAGLEGPVDVIEV